MENDNVNGDITLDTLQDAYAESPQPEPPQQLRLARFLRQIADFYEQHPTVTVPLWVNDFSLSVYPHNDPKEFLSQIGSFEKKYNDSSSYGFSAIKHFADGTLEFRFERNKVCTRKVVGKRIVPLQVRPAELVPEQVIPEHEEDIVEWECGEPLLKPNGPVLAEEHVDASSSPRPVGSVCAECLREDCTDAKHDAGWIMKDSLKSPAVGVLGSNPDEEPF